MRADRLAAAAALALAAPSAALAAPPAEPGNPPLICASDAFADQVGTPGDDTLAAPDRATRLYGLAGDDGLTGSRTRAACLFGGPDDDRLELNTGGGVAWGETGRDTVLGSPLGDVIDGGRGVDGVAAGDGDDKITVRDGRPEMVDCGNGADIVKGDRIDVLIGCESVSIAGREARRLDAYPSRTRATGMVRVRLRVPRSAGEGAYRLIYVTGALGRPCGGGPREITRFPAQGQRVRRGQHVTIGLPSPELGWCEGTARVVVVRYPRRALPGRPVARFSFSVR